MSKLIELNGLCKTFDGQRVLDNINLYIRDKEFVTLLGPSGCGKTTLLRMIGGFETPDEGTVIFDGKDITALPPHKRTVNTIFQRYALFPHLNVYENIAFALRMKRVPTGTLDKKGNPRTRRMSREEIDERVQKMLKLVSLCGFENRDVTSLSGGQQQRVAIARSLINEPRVLLLDEPLAALDLKLRKDMQKELKEIQQATNITFIYVTHDQEEALSMSDTVVVIQDGHIQQIGTPTDIYNEPVNAFVADFIGESNIVDGTMPCDKQVTINGLTFPCVDGGFAPGEAVDVVIRPEDIDIVSPEAGVLRGVITACTFKGVHYEYIVDVNGFKWMIQSTDFSQTGSEIGLSIDPDAFHIMHKSQYSGMFGDYSTFSDEMEELSNPNADLEEDEVEEEETEQ